MNKELMSAVATDAFAQAQEGFAVPLDPDLADALGAFAEEVPAAVVGAWWLRPDVQPTKEDI